MLGRSKNAYMARYWKDAAVSTAICLLSAASQSGCHAAKRWCVACRIPWPACWDDICIARGERAARAVAIRAWLLPKMTARIATNM
eukprot:3211328-Prymnesium_polylepis.1